MSDELSPDKPDWTPPTPGSREVARQKGEQLKRSGIVICGSSAAIFAPALLMMQRRGVSPLVLYILLAFWLMDFAFGISFIVRGNKLMQQGSERNG